MKNVLIYLAIIGLFSFRKANDENQISSPANAGAIPSFTTTAKGDIVLSWVEKDAQKKVSFYYSLFDGTGFGKPRRVPIVDSAATHAEGMPRLSIKKDGSMIVSFELKKDNPTSRFGSDLLYVYSADGVNWSAPMYVQADRDPKKSHSFSRPVRLADGEIGIIWLDEKLTAKGRSVKFARTTPGKGFGEEKIIDNQACECCRIEAITDKQGGLHIFYRDMYEDGSRDMSYIHSADNGFTFSKPRNVYPDKWQIDACPHSGPSATETTKGVWLTWFTGKEKAAGVKVCDIATGKIINAELTDGVKQPQLTTTTAGLPVLAFAKGRNQGEAFFHSIALRKLGAKVSTTYITEPLADCSYPALIANGNSVLVAFEKRIDGQPQVIAWKKIQF
ncbi:exo-alpha-sialidase [Emticicia fluvialis]|uniref:exo-alpha-sialidase n=1 Tax=Emticicia fluvialis TaxID=2974474 RepID=UPI002166452E|nr:exo-alpha-sialidase [Emticicia fluvialis]